MTVATKAADRPAYAPAIPDTLEKLGISDILVQDLLLRRVFIERTSTLTSLGKTLKLSPAVVETVFRQMRHRQLVEVLGMVGNDYSFMLSSTGRQLATERFQITQYAGACPVPLAQFHAATRAQSAKVVGHSRETPPRPLRPGAHRCLAGPVGPGPHLPGRSLPLRFDRQRQDLSGREADPALRRRCADPVCRRGGRPDHHASTIRWFTSAVDSDDDVPEHDPRWVRCRRPCIITGGELVPSMLDLRMDEASGTYAAPLQMKANNGILVIDDFGRQLIPPRDLLNRWIVPLDRRVDYLMLRYGVKFQIPFELMVVFATNLDPNEPGRRGLPAAHSEQDSGRRGVRRGVRRDPPAILARQRRFPTIRTWPTTCAHCACTTAAPCCAPATPPTSAACSSPSASTKGARPV